MRIRRAEEADLPAMGRILEGAGRNMVGRYQPEAVPWFPGDTRRNFPLWKHVMATGGTFLAEDPGPVGFASAVVRDGVWFLSQLWVVPERQRRGIGSALLDEALAWGRGASRFSVVASPDPSAQTLYLRRSMLPVWNQYEFSGEGGQAEMPEGFDLLTDDDQPWVDDLDREVRGQARPEDHAFWRGTAAALALRRGGRGTGYVYAWPDGKIGPGAARDAGDVTSLLRAGRARVGGSATVIVPAPNWAALLEVTRLRLRLIGSTVFMASRPFPIGDRYLSSGGALA